MIFFLKLIKVNYINGQTINGKQLWYFSLIFNNFKSCLPYFLEPKRLHVGNRLYTHYTLMNSFQSQKPTLVMAFTLLLQNVSQNPASSVKIRVPNISSFYTQKNHSIF